MLARNAGMPSCGRAPRSSMRRSFAGAGDDQPQRRLRRDMCHRLDQRPHALVGFDTADEADGEGAAACVCSRLPPAVAERRAGGLAAEQDPGVGDGIRVKGRTHPFAGHDDPLAKLAEFLQPGRLVRRECAGRSEGGEPARGRTGQPRRRRPGRQVRDQLCGRCRHAAPERPATGASRLLDPSVARPLALEHHRAADAERRGDVQRGDTGYAQFGRISEVGKARARRPRMEVEDIGLELSDQLLELRLIDIRGVALHRRAFPEIVARVIVGRRRDRAFYSMCDEGGSEVADIDLGSSDRVGKIEPDAMDDAQAHAAAGHRLTIGAAG